MGLYQDNLQHQLERLVKCDVSVSGSWQDGTKH